MVITEFSFQFRKEVIYHLIDCYQDSPIFEEVEEEYEQLLDIAYQSVHPRAVLHFGRITKEIASQQYPEGTEVIYTITTVGGELSQKSTVFFQNGNYLAGMLADAMADDYLFQMDNQVKEMVAELSRQQGFGIAKRLEAPQDILMEAQKVAFDQSDAGKLLGISIKESFMYDPVKSNCQIYVLTNDSSKCHVEHDCRNCTNDTCKLRNVLPVTVRVMINMASRKIQCNEKQSLLSALIDHGIYIPALCDGNGNCGKCRIQVMEGTIPVSPEDEKVFTQEEIAQGYRLACRAYPNENVTIALEQREEDNVYIITESAGVGGDKVYMINESADVGGDKVYMINESADVGEDKVYAINGSADVEEDGFHSGGYVLVIDIGTTTLAIQLIANETKKILNTYTAMNHQRVHGADVISRIQASNNGKKLELQAIIRRDLLEGIHQLLPAHMERLCRIVVSGNTTMMHLLMGYSCENLGVYPFWPVHIDGIETDYESLFEEKNGNSEIKNDKCEIKNDKCEIKDGNCDISILPGISAFVGADIVAGLYALHFDKNEEICMLVDLGTNGEIAIGNRDRYLVCSTAAGPAFEGGNISCGTASVEGAVSSVEIKYGKASYHTIGEKPPVGICGTGVLECVYELLKAGLVDETGLMDDPYFEDGFRIAENTNGKSPIILTQKDIREVQLAKSAVRAGIETILLRYGVAADQIAHVYIAGGFGYRLNLQKAIGIGLFPPEFQEKLQAVGNTSLMGSRLYACDHEAENRVQSIIGHAEEISLSADKEFMRLYTEYMMFS